MMDYQKVWECFVQGIDFNPKLIKKDILNSWKRCKKYGVSLYDFDIKLLMNPKEKEKYILKYPSEYKASEYQEFCYIVEKLKLNISIYDHNAKLKYIVNYEDIYDDLYPQVGYFLDASEYKIGTNSTSLALIENKPSIVVGADHYKYIFHQFSCAAAPFYSEDNEIAGTINASFVNTSVNDDTLKIIYSLARLYETLILKRANITKKQQRNNKKQNKNFFSFHHILGKSQGIRQAKEVARKASVVNAPVLIYGESGTGKEMFAQAIHCESIRKNHPFVAINCGAIPKDLIESELFGYEEGAFTGALKKGKQGLFEYASGGTLFLDEIESMPLSVQVKILRVLSSSVITRIGGFKDIPIDIRLISASKKNLEQEIKKGNFREDLYYRINVIQVEIPPLRDRKQDIEIILDYYTKVLSKKNQIQIPIIEDSFLQYLESYHWPGNVRELLNIIERSLVLSENGVIDNSILPISIKESCIMDNLKKALNEVLADSWSKGENLLQITEKLVIEHVLKEESHNITKAAQRLGISRPTLYKKIKESEIMKL